MKNTEFLQCTKANVPLNSPEPAVAVQYNKDPQDAITSLVFAIDRGLGRPDKWLDYNTADSEALNSLGEELSREIADPFRGPKPHSPAGQICSGYNRLGAIEVSRGYGYESPTRTNNSHWHKRFLIVTKTAEDTIVAGLYGDENRQHVTEEMVHTQLEDQRFHRMLSRRPIPNVRVSNVQPKTISEFKFYLDQEPDALDTSVANGIHMRAVDAFLATNQQDVQVHHYAGDEVSFMAMAGVRLMDSRSDLGVALDLEAYPLHRGDTIRFAKDEVTHDMVVVDANNEPAGVNLLSVRARPFVRTPDSQITILDSADILLTPERLAAAERLNIAVTGIRDSLLAENS